METSDQQYTNEEQLIDDKFQELLNGYLNSNHRKKVEIIERAFKFAKEAHKGIRRRSGEPYILHPIAVARIVSHEIGLGSTSICAALLHDVVEDTEYTVEDIENHFGKKIASIVDGLTKISGGIFGDQASAQAENFRRLLLTMSEDIRVILIKMADRLHNMRTLGSMLPSKQYKIAGETLYIYAPLAHRLGLFAIKTELEDLAFKYEHPEAYNQIKQKIAETEESRQQIYNNFSKPIVAKLKEMGLEFEMKARVKSIYSIWNKMESKHIPFEEVYDLYAVRIIFKCPNEADEKKECWAIYSVITDIYKLHPERTRDWVSRPKANGYKALHLTVMGPDGNWIEVQIRSEKMDEIAERGFAAHWKYKQAHSSEDEFDKWLKEVRNALKGPTEDAVEFLDNVRLTLYTNEIVVFTPKGEPRKMPQGATVLDFAYNIHTNVGNKAIGAKVNHKIESIFETLKNGDQIEIITSDNSRPNLEWLDHVTTAKAKQSITTYLKRSRENNIERGIELFDRRMEEFGITPSARVFRKILPAYECSNKDEFYSKLGSGIINLDGVDKVLRQNSMSKVLKFWDIQLTKPFKSDKQDTLLVGNSDTKDGNTPKFVIAEGCNPIPGDDIVGYRTPGTNTIVVHKAGCEDITRLAAQHGENIVTSIKWSSYKAESYLAEIEVRGIDRVGILVDLSQVITLELGINIRELAIQSHDGIFEGKISVYVKDTENLNALLDRVGSIKGIEKVKRTL